MRFGYYYTQDARTASTCFFQKKNETAPENKKNLEANLKKNIIFAIEDEINTRQMRISSLKQDVVFFLYQQYFPIETIMFNLQGQTFRCNQISYGGPFLNM